MYSFDETQSQSLKQKGEKIYEKKNHSGIAVHSATADAIG